MSPAAIQLYRKDLGLDFALIPLPDLIRAAFEKNRIIPVSRENWIHQPEVTFSQFRILGFPSHLVHTGKNLNDELVAEFQPAMVGVEGLDSPPWRMFLPTSGSSDAFRRRSISRA